MSQVQLVLKVQLVQELLVYLAVQDRPVQLVLKVQLDLVQLVRKVFQSLGQQAQQAYRVQQDLHLQVLQVLV